MTEIHPAARCTLCSHREDQHDTLPDGTRPCRSIGHEKGLTCAECRRLTSREHVDAVMALRGEPDDAFTAAWAAYYATLDHVRKEIGPGWQAFFTDVHQSALASAVLVLREQAGPDARAGVLSDTDRKFLTFALDLVGDKMASQGDEFDADDDAAMERLRRMADAKDDGPECTACGDSGACAGGPCAHPDAAADETQPPRHRWAVEFRDGVAGEWVSCTRYLVRQRAVDRYHALSKHHPTWKDGTPVERRLVRETVTYTVEDPDAPADAGGAQS
jgi:hypothetical protein